MIKTNEKTLTDIILEVEDLRKRVEKLEKRTSDSDIYLEGAPDYVVEYLKELEKDEKNDG